MAWKPLPLSADGPQSVTWQGGKSIAPRVLAPYLRNGEGTPFYWSLASHHLMSFYWMPGMCWPLGLHLLFKADP